MRAAIGDAAFMTQMEKNSDIVVMNCYAPMFVNVNPGARQWRPNLIGYDGLRVYGSPSYHAIKMFSTHLGDRDPEGDADRHRRARLGHARQPGGHDLRQAGERGRCGRPGAARHHRRAHAGARPATAVTLVGGCRKATNSIDAAAGGRAGDVEGVRRQVRFHLHGPGARHRRVDARGALTPRMWEERWHPLREEWVIVAAHRQSRPWSGAEVGHQAPAASRVRSRVLSLPGQRAGERRRQPSLHRHVRVRQRPPVRRRGRTARADAPVRHLPEPPATGVARVVCYSPRHDVTLAELDVDGVDALLETWQQQMRELAAHPDVAFVLIFENKGEVVGVSNPHPHCQIYATNFTFKYIETELARRPPAPRADRPISVPGHPRRGATGRAADRQPARQRDRVRSRTSRATPTRPTSRRCGASRRLRTWTTDERRDLATVLRDVVIRFDNLWRMPFPVRHGAAPGAGEGRTSEGSTSTSSSIRRCAGRTC